MNTAYVIARHELRDRSRLLLVALIMSLATFVPAFMPSTQNKGVAVLTLAAVLAIAWASTVALALGVSTIGRELAEKRLSFYFSKPVSPAAIWAGKTSAALLLIAATVVIIMLPATLMGYRDWSSMWNADGRFFAAWTIVQCMALYFGSHAVTTMVRSRSMLLALDFIFALATAGSLILMTRPLIVAGTMRLAGGLVTAVFAAILLILAVAPVWQLANGRADVRRNHVALSRALWPAVGVTLAIAGGFVAWLTSASLESLDTIARIDQSRSGAWLVVSGSDDARGGFPATFLVNAATNETEKVRTPMWWGAGFSRSGNAVAWMEPTDLLPRNGRMRLMMRRLDQPGAKTVATPIVTTFGSSYVLSPDASRVLVGRGSQIEVVETATGRLLAATSDFSGRDFRWAFFVTNDLVRMIEHDRRASQGRVLELDVARKKVRELTTLEGPPAFGISASEDGSLMYVRHNRTIVDGVTGAVRATLPADVQGHLAEMLADGTVVTAGNGALRHFSADGRELSRVALPMPKAYPLAQIGEKKVLLVSNRHSVIVDLARGTVEKSAKDARPAVTRDQDPRLVRLDENAPVRYGGAGGKVGTM